MQDDEKDVVVDDDIHQRISALKQRRRNDRINQILSAAAEGDLASMKAALKVQICTAFPFTKYKSLIKCCHYVRMKVQMSVTILKGRLSMLLRLRGR